MPEGPAGGGRRRAPRDDSPSGSFRAPRDESPSGSFRAPRDESPSGSFRAPRVDPPGGTFRPLRDDAAGGAFRPVRDEPAGPRAGRGDSPSGVFTRPAAPPPARAAIEPPLPVEPTTQGGGRRRARTDDEPSSGGRRAPERRPSESYDHGPALEPIIKPLADYTPPRTTTEPPPLVPIFPSMRPESSPTSGGATGRRARRAADEPDTTSTGARRRFDEPAGRRARPDAPEDVTGGRRSRAADDPAALRRDDTGTSRRDDTGVSRRDDTGTSRRGRGGFEPVGPDTGIGRQRSGPGLAGGPSTGSGYAPGADPSSVSGPAYGSPVSGPAYGAPVSGPAAGPASGPGHAGPGTGGPATARRGGFYTGAPDETTALRRDDIDDRRRDDPAARRRDDTTGFRRDDTTGFRRDDTGTGRRGRGFDEYPARRDDTGTRRRDGFEPAGFEPHSAAFEASGTATRRRPAADEAPHQRRPLDDGLPFDEPSGAGRRGRGRGTGEYTSGGTQRALREPAGTRPAGRPDNRRPGKPRTAVVDPVRVEHKPHRWIAALSAIGVFVLLAACGLGSWFIFKDEKNGPDSARSSATAGPKKRDISSRQVDPAPLTEAEVFPQNNIVAVANEPPYVILKTQASPDCKTAATDELATLLAGAGCSEVVRATMKSPNEEYLITAGIFNLDTEKAAATAFDGVKPIVDGQKGRFAGMSVGAGTGTDAIVRAPTQLGWNYRGHFIAFVVIARVDGKEFAPDDPYPNQITYDIVETYLENGIIGNRAIVQPDATPAASLPAAPPS
ncbi:hypothetical protein Daura_47920 [Dactylosporangium aurantiacum]|uniref:Uncharacterized protein n=1 Tax=Dactylosporangium aurantiacum TaxID=35754 RepID=A0A9Q9IGC2_9ACTN|nr:hypothetical protein [Dactylosporangium aurantiacum]MDG6105328.1 hypothetical protein [Dactylosporangium aurantiacum]UWZ54123.1 hypothetical protein Daura_47920 [Dactylosporangium aurantiacum]